jgi:hypothetical protein
LCTGVDLAGHLCGCELRALRFDRGAYAIREPDRGELTIERAIERAQEERA